MDVATKSSKYLKYVNEQEIILNKIKERLFQNDKTGEGYSAHLSLSKYKRSLRNKTGGIHENVYQNIGEHSPN